MHVDLRRNSTLLNFFVPYNKYGAKNNIYLKMFKGEKVENL